MEVREVQVDGHGGSIPLSIAEAGTGGRPLVLVHGFTGAKEDFTDWLDPLAELGWHAIAPDQRGHGESHKPTDERAYSFEIFAADLLGLLDAMGWSSAVALGHSMGGMVLQTAALNNERTAVNLLGRRLTASVLLVKALGGGWDAAALEQLRLTQKDAATR